MAIADLDWTSLGRLALNLCSEFEQRLGQSVGRIHSVSEQRSRGVPQFPVVRLVTKFSDLVMVRYSATLRPITVNAAPGFSDRTGRDNYGATHRHAGGAFHVNHRPTVHAG